MGLNVLSLFDGMSCGQIALNKLGIKVDNYYASEIKKHAIKATQDNFPNTIQLGDVTKVIYKDGFLYTENGVFEVGKIDLVLAGSPCQDLSGANKNQKGLKGLKSRLFFDYLRILKEVHPKYFLLENVASMKDHDKNEMSYHMGCEPIFINSSSFLPHLRKRLYWTNLNVDEVKDVRTLNLQDILTEGYTPRILSKCLSESYSRPNVDKLKLTRRTLETGFMPVCYGSEEEYLKMMEHYEKHYKGLSAVEVDKKRDLIDNSVYNTTRVYNKIEMERLQGVPEGYTKNLSRNEAASLLGDGWTVDVIAHIFKGLK